jgi:hypothetical protein
MDGMDTATESPAPESSDIRPVNVAQVKHQLSVMHATRTWIQYGVFGFAVFCIVLGAVEALFGR